MRLAFLCSTFHPTVGGAETYARTLCGGLADMGDEVHIITDCVEGYPREEEIKSGLWVHRLSSYRNGLNRSDRIRWEQMHYGLDYEVERLVTEVHPQLVFSNSLDLAVIAKAISLQFLVPWVATSHEQKPELAPLGVGRLRLVYEALRPDLVLAGSEFYQHRTQQFSGGAPVWLVYHGVDTEKFAPREPLDGLRESYAIRRSSRLVVSIGRISGRKGFLDLLEAVRREVEDGADLHLLIAGTVNSGSSAYKREIVEYVTRHSLLDRFTLEERASHDRIPEILSIADVVVQASHDEGLGLALLESMACGRPNVVTNIRGFREIASVSDALEVVPPHDPAAIAVAIRRVLDDPLRSDRMGELGRSEVVERFSIERMVTQTRSLLAALLDGGPGNA